MDELLKKILGSELLNEETRKEVAATFKKVLEEAKAEQDKAIRAEYAERYERDKVKIAEAVEPVEEQRLKYVNAQASLKEQARKVVQNKIALLVKVTERAMAKEIKELHDEMTTNRKAVLKTITETKARAEAERGAFKVKAAKVLEHIMKVKMEREFGQLREDIKIAKENDFGRRIYEAFMSEARRSFFNSSKEHKALLGKISEQETAHKTAIADLTKKLGAATTQVEAVTKNAKKLQESVARSQTMNKLLATVPAGTAREKMKLILEATSTANLDGTFKKYASQVLAEGRRSASPVEKKLNNLAIELRTGNAKNTLTESANSVEDDDEIINLRRRAAIQK